jgi:tetratricopeptide (TPR) repeat protein
MRLNPIQIIVLVSTVILFALLLSVGRTKPLNKKGDDSAAETDTLPPMTDEVMLAGARKALDSVQINLISELESRVTQAKNIEEEVLVFKLISRTWNEFGNFAAGAYYAQKVAELKSSGESWAVAGTSFGIAFNREMADIGLKKYLGNKAVVALQKAIEQEPDSISYAINEAIMYVELSMVDSKVLPMTGAQKLLALDKKHPDNININLQLGRLSYTRSGDVQKAIPRFLKVIELSEKSKLDSKAIILEANFSLAECYKQLGNKEKTLYYYKKCVELSSDNPKVQKELQQALDKFEKEGK